MRRLNITKSKRTKFIQNTKRINLRLSQGVPVTGDSNNIIFDGENVVFDGEQVVAEPTS